MRPILISGGRVIDPSRGTDAVSDVYVADGKVQAVGRDLGRPDDALVLQFAVGLGHSVAVNAELLGKIADTRKLVTGAQRAGRGGVFDLLGYLQVGRFAGFKVQFNAHFDSTMCPSTIGQ